MSKITFPKDFIWGSATSSYQMEGAFDQDGKANLYGIAFAIHLEPL